MSSLRNAVARRPHKERAQPQSRAKWGILEKHSDYSLRAKDYNLKKRKLGELERKKSERNEDEFAFGMKKAVAGKRGWGEDRPGEGLDAGRLSHETAQLLKTQDAGYLRVVGGRARRELERLEREVGLQRALEGNGAMTTKIVFTDGGEDGGLARGQKRTADGEVLGEVAVENLPPEKDDMSGSASEEESSFRTARESDVNEDGHEDEMDYENDVKITAPALQQSEKMLEKARRAVIDLRAERKRRKRLADARAVKLEALKKRQREILAAADQLELQRAKMARSVGGVNGNGLKFKIRERRK